jgi:hypothetical protein
VPPLLQYRQLHRNNSSINISCSRGGYFERIVWVGRFWFKVTLWQRARQALLLLHHLSLQLRSWPT